jgi:hypothetical protein
VIQTVRTVALLDVALVAVLELLLIAGVMAWLLEAIWRAAAQYARAGRIKAGQARQLLFRGALGLAIYTVSAVVVPMVDVASQHMR